MAAGLATPLTIGPADYLCGSTGCAGRNGAQRIRHLVLKDTQIMPDGRLKLQEEWVFCGKPGPGDAAPVGKGRCRGSGGPYEGGTWAFTVNGQLDPEIAVGDGRGEVWRILNASANVTYWLAIEDAQGGAALPVQVLSVDGVSLEIPTGQHPARAPGEARNEDQGRALSRRWKFRAAGYVARTGLRRASSDDAELPGGDCGRAVGREVHPGRAAKPCLRHRPRRRLVARGRAGQHSLSGAGDREERPGRCR